MKISERGSTYHQLIGTLRSQSGCPICHIWHHAGRTYLDAMLWESVNDPGLRERLTASLGLCHDHSLQLLTFPGERLGVAILQQAVLATALQQLHDSPTVSAGWLRRMRSQHQVPGASDSATTCLACVQAQASAQRALQSLIKYFDAEMETLLQAAGGLCHSHLHALLAQTDVQPAIRDRLVSLHRQVWEEVLHALAEFIRKSDHRFSDEPITEAERIAIERSIAILTGETCSS